MMIQSPQAFFIAVPSQPEQKSLPRENFDYFSGVQGIVVFLGFFISLAMARWVLESNSVK
jgi:hypothetical protein